jgi:hypothetical protein
MSCEFFTETNFRAKTLGIIESANVILSEYRGQGFRLTLRQLYYQFVARQLMPNEPAEYARLGRTVVDARRAGMIDWESMEDRTRGLEDRGTWDSPSAADSYRENLWKNQIRRVEVWVEKAALAGVIKPVCERWRVPFMAARGYPSHSELYAAGKRLEAHIEDNREPVILYLGDHDPSGLDMTRSLQTELSLYAGDEIEVERLGLNLGQIRELNLPPNPAKETDKRYSEYVRETGCTDSWELDALQPTYIDRLVDGAIRFYVNAEDWRNALALERESKRRLYEFAESFGGEARR